MMPVIRISDPVFERLQSIATPLVDTPGSVVEKLLDFYESHQTGSHIRPATTTVRKTESEFDPEAPPDVRHTRVLQAEFDGQSAENWNDLVHLAHRRATVRLKSFDAIRAATQSNVVPRQKSDRGFHYLSDINLSIQNVDANLAWRNALVLARKLQVPVRVQFEWRETEGAAHPGKVGLLSWTPERASA